MPQKWWGFGKRRTSSYAEFMTRQLKISRFINVVLAAIVVILVVVVIAQGQDRTSTALPGSDGSPAASGSGDGNTSGEVSDPTEEPAQPDSALYVRNDPNDPMAIGDIDAPIVLSEWMDFRCPYCAVFANETLPLIIDEYVETGKVRIEFNLVDFFGEDSTAAGIAGLAAAEQGYFMEFADDLFIYTSEQAGKADLPRDVLIGIAQNAGVPDINKFAADLDSPELAAKLEADRGLAQALGVSSVPFFVVNGTVLTGAQPFEAFQQLFDSQL